MKVHIISFSHTITVPILIPHRKAENCALLLFKTHLLLIDLNFMSLSIIIKQHFKEWQWMKVLCKVAHQSLGEVVQQQDITYRKRGPYITYNHYHLRWCRHNHGAPVFKTKWWAIGQEKSILACWKKNFLCHHVDKYTLLDFSQSCTSWSIMHEIMTYN